MDVWSAKNKKLPSEYGPYSAQLVWWKCENNKHKDYHRKISDSNKCNFRCPKCQYSEGEDKINQYLINNGFIKITQEQYKKLSNKTINYYVCQKEFDNLLGVGNGNLSYDFYLLNYNLLIEYQGEFHDYEQKGMYKRTKYLINNLEKQAEHDRRKREYAKDNDIELLEIWYYDFDNIEQILDDYFKNNKINIKE